MTSPVTTEADLRPDLRLGRPVKAALAAFVVLLSALFLGGTFWGSDASWPFGPWRMYATSTPPSGPVAAIKIEVETARDPAWSPASLTPDTVGLNRAEIEGRIPRIQVDPSMLGTLIASHAELRPREPAWTAIRVVRSETLLADGAPTGETRDVTLVVWPASARTAADDTPRIITPSRAPASSSRAGDDPPKDGTRADASSADARTVPPTVGGTR